MSKMNISHDAYRAIIQQQLSGDLTIFIDTSGFRQLLDDADPSHLTEVVGHRMHSSIAFIRFLSRIDFVGLLLSIGLSIPAFGFWALLIAPGTILAWMLYKGRASMGKQSLSGAGFVLAVGVGVAVAMTSWSLWTGSFAVAVAATFFLIKLLYVATSRLVFGLIHSSYGFFRAYYLQPEGAMIPLIWTHPEFKPGEVAR
jgi:hypothetical protein